MTSKQILDTLKKYEACSSMNKISIIWKSAEDSIITDINDKRYIDFSSGIFVSNSGHSATVNAIRAQCNHHLIYAYDYPTEIRARLVEKLVSISPKFVEKVFLLSTGAEAVECAVKLMRMYTKKRIIVSIAGSMHGKTMLAEQLRGNSAHTEISANVWHLAFPTEQNIFDGDILGCPYQDKIAGVILESYQGWSGRFYPKQYIKDLVKWTRKNKILICFDEVQGGFWRTGKLFAYQHYEVEPDLICVGKGLGNGVPISAVMGRKELLDLPSDLTSTHSGNALCCASALSSLEQLDKLDKKDLEQKAKQLAYYLYDLKRAYRIIKEVNCKGLLVAIIFKTEKIATKLCQIASQTPNYYSKNHSLHFDGLLLVHTGKESVKLGMPLTITKKILHEGLKMLDISLKELSNGNV